MPYTAQAIDSTEPFSDTDWEISANVGDYNVVSGCALTYDAANMTVDIAAGVVTHNGVTVTVAAQENVVTLVSDGSNPRWAWIYIDSSGVGGITHGTAAATPSKAELGDNVALSAVLIATAATIANDQTKIDKRLPAPAALIILKTSDQTHTQSNTTLEDDTELLVSVLANSTYSLEMVVLTDSGSTPDYKFGWSVPASCTIQGQYSPTLTTTALSATMVESAESGVFGNGAGNVVILVIHAVIIVAGTAGTVTFRHAQNTSDASDTKTLANSWMRVRRLA